MRPTPPFSCRGTLVSYNLSPKGVPEGMIVRPDDAESSAVVQINFPPELAGAVTAAAAEGSAVTVEAEGFAGAEPDAAHPVYD